MPGNRLHGPDESPGGGSSEKIPENQNDIRLLLVGKTGHGKSATANSILGLKKGHVESFLEKMSSKSVTTDVGRKTAVRFGRRIEVVDCPGFCDTLLTEEQLIEAIFKAIALTVPGFTAIGFVLKADRFTDDLVESVKLVIKYFGNNIERSAFVILTHLDEEGSAEDYLTDGHEFLEKLKCLCIGGKTVLINNTCNDAEKESQVRRIIDEIESIEQKNGNSFYTNKMFEVTTRFALECIPVENVENIEKVNATPYAIQSQRRRLELFKIRVEDGEIIFADLLQRVRYEIFNLSDFMAEILNKCSIL